MNEAFSQLEMWLSDNAQPLLHMLNPPANAEDIASFEARTSLLVPLELRLLYSIHNGEADESDGIFGCQKLLPLSAIADEIELIGSQDILPFLRSGGGDLYYVKCHGSGDIDRKVYEWWHEKPEEAAVIAESVEAWFSEFVLHVCSGRYVYRTNELVALIDSRDIRE